MLDFNVASLFLQFQITDRLKFLWIITYNIEEGMISTLFFQPMSIPTESLRKELITSPEIL